MLGCRKFETWNLHDFYYESKFPALLSVANALEKSAGISNFPLKNFPTYFFLKSSRKLRLSCYFAEDNTEEISSMKPLQVRNAMTSKRKQSWSQKLLLILGPNSEYQRLWYRRATDGTFVLYLPYRSWMKYLCLAWAVIDDFFGWKTDGKGVQSFRQWSALSSKSSFKGNPENTTERIS